jgi:putative Holliday junction resolvase
VDYGRKRIGVAVSDAMGLTVQPLTTIEGKSKAEELALLERIAHERGVARIVVGLPLRLDGTEGTMAAEARRFARRLERALHLPVELVDERLTSWAAREWKAAHAELGRGKGEDEIAAAILLEDFLARNRENGD